ncbi:urease accessory protein UreF [Advenella kashmirensis]
MHTPENELNCIAAQHYAQLMRLSSPALPVGGFSYSQGFESAVELGIVFDEATAGRWIEDTLHTVMAQCDAAIWLLIYRAWRELDTSTICQWNQWYYASRETAEARAETSQMGVSLINLAHALDWGADAQRSKLNDLSPPCFPTVHAFCVQALDLPSDAGISAFIYTWLENQVMAAIKTVPLGQTAGQRLLSTLVPQLDRAVLAARKASSCSPPAIMTLAPQYSIIAARHESQFSRLFRS